ncbi:MAG: anaerobic ribonucleoside-triphosphate reductase activating protein [Deltaproteobacteria bacterium]|nr:anaerobic ribonucleoside-triphosphate reductase activating protein [Deltaproteobacteria bacterium]
MSHDLLNIHSIIPLSKVNGPGNRMVVFFQGCDKNCPGCFNPDTHSFETISLYSPGALFKKYPPNKRIEGITLSGGEPFLQPEGLFELLKTAKENFNLSTVVYTGFTYKEIRQKPECLPCLEFIDVLIDGRYVESKKEPSLLARGSTNQRLYLLSSRYKREDFYMPGKIEVIIGKDGVVTNTGFGKIDIKQAMQIET